MGFYCIIYLVLILMPTSWASWKEEYEGGRASGRAGGCHVGRILTPQESLRDVHCCVGTRNLRNVSSRFETFLEQARGQEEPENFSLPRMRWVA